MYKDIMSYELAAGKTESDLLAAAERVLEKWMSRLDGFVPWEIHKTASGYGDIVTWQDKAPADEGERSMQNDIPEELSAAWQSNYDFGTIKGEKLESVFVFKK